MYDKIFGILLNKEEITWKNLIYTLVKSEEMDPWDINVSELTKKYIEMIKKLKELDFNVSGKVLLAAAILLRMKSNILIDRDISQFDSMLAGYEEDFDEEYDEETGEVKKLEKHELIPKTPQPRKRKVSVYDLVNALQQALEVKKRRLHRIPKVEIEVPEKKFDISNLMQQIYSRILNFFKTGDKVTFTQLVPTDTKENKVHTFIPLLHLANMRKLDLHQEKHFGEINILLNKANISKDISKELENVEV